MFSRFDNFHQICRLIQDFIYISRYNLKRNKISNRNVLTYVCSCISQKRMNNKPNLNDIEMNNDKTETSSLKRNVKRDNVQSCHFRIRFKKTINTEAHHYVLVLSANLIHNHPPDKSKNKEVIIYIYNSYTL